MTKPVFAVGLLMAFATLPVMARDHAVRGCVKKDGAYVAPHALPIPIVPSAITIAQSRT